MGSLTTKEGNLADEEKKEAKEVAAFLDAASVGRVEDVRGLLNEGFNVSSENDNGDTAMDLAIKHGHTDVVRALIAAWYPLIGEETFEPPVLTAAFVGDTEVAAVLLAAGAPVDGGDFRNGTPLVCATQQEHLACVELLVAAGADLHALHPNCLDTPLHLAVVESHVECVEALLKAGADVNARNGYRQIPLYSTNDTKISFLLAKVEANLNARDCDSNTPVHMLAQFGPAECLEQLLRFGANLCIRNNGEERPIDVSRAGHYRILLKAVELKGRFEKNI